MGSEMCIRDSNEGDRVSLRWESDNADSCYGEGPGFRTSDRTGGTYTSITEPSAGNSYTYTVTCTNDDGDEDSDSLTITTRDDDDDDELDPPTVTLRRRVDNGSWRTSSVTINEGDRVSLRWESDNADSCYGEGPGFRTSDRTGGTDTSITEPSAGNLSLIHISEPTRPY